MWLWLIFSFVLLDIQLSAQYGGRIVCYYRSDNVYRAEGYRMQPQEVDPELCTHVIYYFAHIDLEKGVAPSDPHVDMHKGGYKKMVKLKEINPDLKIMLSVRGDPESKDMWPWIAGHESRRQWFSSLTINFLRTHRFDGLDMDYQIHERRTDSKNYLLLVEEMRAQMELESLEYGLPQLELSLLLPAQIQKLHGNFDLAALGKSVDFINVGSMDYWSLDPTTVQHHAPLFRNQTEGSLSPLNVDESIKYYLYKCVPPEKLVLGVPTYGRSFRLDHRRMSNLGSQCKYPGQQGFATASPGIIAYFEICIYIQEDNWSVENVNLTSMGPYAYYGDRWVGFDDVAIISRKAKYARDRGLGGLMFWTIDQDDFRGYCHYKNALIRAGKFTLNTGIQVWDAPMLQDAEMRWIMQTSTGYFYPMPTIHQPSTHLEGEIDVRSTVPPKLKPDYQKPSTATAKTTVPSTRPTPVHKKPTTATVVTRVPSTRPTPVHKKPTTATVVTTVPSTTSTRSTPVYVPLMNEVMNATTPKPTSGTTIAKPIVNIPTPAPPKSAPDTTTSTTMSSSTAATPLKTPSSTQPVRNNNPPPSTTQTSGNPFAITPIPNINTGIGSDTDPNVNNAILQLNRVLETVNQVVNSANAVSRTQTPGAFRNGSIDPSLFNLFQPLLNIRNTADFTVENPVNEPGKPNNSTVSVQSDVKKISLGNIQSAPLLDRSQSNDVLTQNSIPEMSNDLFSGRRLILNSGRDIININLNISINNNYYQNNRDL